MRLTGIVSAVLAVGLLLVKEQGMFVNALYVFAALLLAALLFPYPLIL